MRPLITLCSCLFLASAEPFDAAPPNIVLIISDDQAYTDFGFMGHKQVLTPHLDRLAAQSARYTGGYVPTSVCRPSLATLLTGLYPHQHGVHFNELPQELIAVYHFAKSVVMATDAMRVRRPGE